MASVIRGSDNFDSFANSGIGVNQTWQDVTASRSAGVTYTNTTGKPIFVSVVATGSTSQCTIVVDGLTVTTNGIASSGWLTNGGNAIVPNGSTYYVDTTYFTMAYWRELR